MRMAAALALMTLLQAGTVEAQATVIAASGKVSIRRDGWSGWLPARFGTAVGTGDLLHTGPGSSVAVLCPDLTRGTLDADETSGAPCTVARTPVRAEGGVLLAPLRSGHVEAEHALTLLGPRWTRVEDARPTIRWAAPPAVTEVQVTVRGVGVEWSTKVKGASLVYPANAPRLIPGRQYSVLITAGSLSSTRDGEGWPVFEVVAPEQLAEIRRQVAKVRALSPSTEQKTFLEGHLLAARGLRAAAIDRLQPIAPGSAEPVIHRLLAHTYQNVGLDRLAIDSYRAAAARSAALGDLDGEAQAAAALGELCQRSKRCAKGEAQGHLRRALAIYEQIGAKDELTRLRRLR
ncbi:MAG TPA: hypothetical protein VF432_08920 [Thermoanaerobaculia bacterium]